jgi:hypothetical protein
MDINDSNDIAAIQIEGQFGTASIINIYNNQKYSRTLVRADTAITDIPNNISALPQPHDHYLVTSTDTTPDGTRKGIDSSSQPERSKTQLLIDILDEHHLDMALPKDVPTLEFMGLNKNWTRPDNVFCSHNVTEILVKCTTVPGERGAGTDHVPIDAVLSLPVTRTTPAISHNF